MYRESINRKTSIDLYFPVILVAWSLAALFLPLSIATMVYTELSIMQVFLLPTNSTTFRQMYSAIMSLSLIIGVLWDIITINLAFLYVYSLAKWLGKMKYVFNSGIVVYDCRIISMYTHNVSFCIKKCKMLISYTDIILRWNSTCSSQRSRTLQRIYRVSQVFNTFANEVFRHWVTLSYYASMVTLISMSFCIIKYHSNLPKIIVVFFTAVTLQITVMFLYILNLLLKLTRCSEDYYTSFSRNYFHCSKEDIGFWKSCRPLVWSVGDWFTISNRDFCPRVVMKVIFESVVNLLLTFR